MRFCLFLGAIVIALNAGGQAPSGKLWTELKAKRDMLAGLHQEFDVSQTLKTARRSQGSNRQIVVDISGDKWRERSISGSGDRVRIFDGDNLFVTEAEGDEYLRVKRRGKEDHPEPAPYGGIELEWAKAAEVQRQPCGFPGADHICIIVNVPVKPWVRSGTSSEISRMSAGVSRMALDSETGMLVQSNTQEAIDNARGGYQLEIKYSL